MDVIEFDWLSRPVDVDPAIELRRYTLEDTTLNDCSQNYTAGKQIFKINGYTCI